MRHFALSAVAAATLFFATTWARADIVKLDSFAYGPAASLTVGSPDYTGAAGAFAGTRDGNAFLTFCVDLLQSFHFGQTYGNYSVVSGAAAFGAKSNEMDRMMSYFLSTGYVSDAATSATAQAAIWEVLYESGSKYNFSSGSFKATSAGVATQSALNAFDWDAIGGTAISYHVDRLFSPTAQDFLVVTALGQPTDSTSEIPEPSSVSLVGAALAGLVMLGRRRAKARPTR